MDQRQIANRFLDVAVSVIKLSEKISKSSAGKHVTGQITRSITSAGANYEEACGAESKRDFIHKLQVVLKELRESGYWMKLIVRAKLIQITDALGLTDEILELTKNYCQISCNGKK